MAVEGRIAGTGRLDSDMVAFHHLRHRRRSNSSLGTRSSWACFDEAAMVRYWLNLQG